MTPKQIALLIGSIITIVILVVIGTQALTTVDADEIVVKQSLSGEMTVWTSPGWKWQGFGKITRYKKSDQFDFSATKDDKGNAANCKNCIPTRFNDQGSANIGGSLSFDLPLDEKTMLELHNKFRSMDGIRGRLVKPAVIKAVYNSGPLMSSRESAGKRRSDLIQYIQDQATRGVYKTTSREEEVEDLLAPPIETVETIEVPVMDKETGEPKLDDKGQPVMEKKPRKTMKPAMKKITLVEPELGKDGKIIVQEASTVTKFGITMYNITIERIYYEDKVKEQIDKQRDMEMAIQTKIAQAKQAQQDAVTAAENGKASAAKAKWAQEVEKAKAVTAAEQKREVAEKDLEAAKLERQAQVERAKGEAEAKKLVMQADGALDKKLRAYIEVQKAYAQEMGKQRWVPEVVIGDGNAANPNVGFMQFLMSKAARDLALDLGVKP